MSPIKGISDQARASFPVLGKFRKGAEAQRNQQGQVVKMGSDLSYFRFTSERPEVVKAFEAAYGKQPALIYAFLPYARVDENFSAWKEKWTAGGLVHRCDGETQTLWIDAKGKYQRTPKPCDGGCDEVGRLNLIIPELLKAGYVGYVLLETHGIHDLLSIQGSLMAAFDARMGNPLGLRGIQWTLRRVKEKISTPAEGGKRARRDKWLVKLEPAADWVQLQLQQAHNATMMLPAPTGQAVEPEESGGRPVDRDTGEFLDIEAREVPPELEDNPKQAPAPAPEAEAQPPKPNGTIQTPTVDLSAYKGWVDRIDGAASLEALEALAGEVKAAKKAIPGNVYTALAELFKGRKAHLEKAAADALAADQPGESLF